MYTIYGIKNCDTMKKAFAYLDKHKINYTFFDYKKQTLTLKDLERWHGGFGEWPVNKRGTTFRKLKAEYEKATDSQQAAILLDNLSALKRPILEGEGLLLRGFDSEQWPTK